MVLMTMHGKQIFARIIGIKKKKEIDGYYAYFRDNKAAIILKSFKMHDNERQFFVKLKPKS